MRRSHLGDIHWADGRGQAHADTSEHPVYVEHHEQVVSRHAVLEYQKFGKHRAERRYEEHQSCENECLLASQVRRQEARHGTADDTSDKCAGACEAVPSVCVSEVFGTEEECLQSFLCPRDYGRVVSEEQSAEHGDHHDRDKVRFAAFEILFHFLVQVILVVDFLYVRGFCS